MPSCSHCGQEVSPRARTCPRCGEPDPAHHGEPKQAQGCLEQASLVWRAADFGCNVVIWVCVIFAALCVGFFVPESRENLAFIAVTFAGGLAVYWYVDDWFKKNSD